MRWMKSIQRRIKAQDRIPQKTIHSGIYKIDRER
jgi:hypothetical protein